MNYEEFDGGYRTYFNSLKKYKPLNKKEERKLLVRYKELHDLNARNILIQSNLRYACKLASLYIGKGMSYSELISEANKGLMDSIEKYDICNTVKLITYSKWWIIQRMQAAIDKRNKRTEDSLPENDSKENEEYADIPNKNEITFDIEDDTSGKRENVKVLLETLFTPLTERERDMVSMYYGIGYGNSYTLVEIGKSYGLTKERVRQIIQKAFKKMRTEAISSELLCISEQNL